MNRIEEMIKKMCPDGVRRVKLGVLEEEHVISLGRGNVISKDDITSTPGSYPVFSSSSKGNGEIGYYALYMFDDERITWSIDGGGKLFYRNNLRYSVTNVCGWIKVNNENILSTKYLYYSLYQSWTNITFNYNHKAHPSVIKEEYVVHLPPLPIQQEIVNILDHFTALQQNLEDELALRQKQYEHYREKLLTFEESECEWKKLGELFTFKNGLNKGKEFFGSGSPIIMFSRVFNNRALYETMIDSYVDITESELSRIDAKKNDVFFTRTSETQEDVGMASVLLSDMKVCTYAGFLIRARPITDNLLPEYCKYCFATSEMRNNIVSKSSFTTRASLTGGGLAEVDIPVPPLSKQLQIVQTLDRFESLISNLKTEIELRKKQYEYYREKLLTF